MAPTPEAPSVEERSADPPSLEGSPSVCTSKTAPSAFSGQGLFPVCQQPLHPRGRHGVLFKAGWSCERLVAKEGARQAQAKVGSTVPHQGHAAQSPSQGPNTITETAQIRRLPRPGAGDAAGPQTPCALWRRLVQLLQGCLAAALAPVATQHPHFRKHPPEKPVPTPTQGTYPVFVAAALVKNTTQSGKCLNSKGRMAEGGLSLPWNVTQPHRKTCYHHPQKGTLHGNDGQTRGTRDRDESQTRFGD